MLCATRIILSPILGYLVLQKSFDFALGVFVFAGATDLVIMIHILIICPRLLIAGKYFLA